MEPEQYIKIIEGIRKGKTFDGFKEENGNLLQRTSRQKTWREVVLKGFTEEIMREAHNNPLAGHFGKNKTIEKIANRYYWPRMRDEITAYVASCYICQTMGRRKKNNPNYPIIVTNMWERVGIDFIGPLRITPKGNRYIITAMDYFSHWPEAKAVPEATAEQAARFIYEELICRHGIVTTIQTDQGTHFKNELIKGLVEKFKIKHHFITAYHPQANGLIERFNGTLKQTLAKISEETYDWDNYVAQALFAYRSHKVASIGVTPALMNYGRELRLPGQYSNQMTVWDRIEYMVSRVPILRESVIPALKRAKEKDQQRHKINQTTFEIGDQVMIAIENRRPLAAKVDGPVTLIRKYNNGTYAYEQPDRTISKAINGDRLKLFKHRLNMEPIVVIETDI